MNMPEIKHKKTSLTFKITISAVLGILCGIFLLILRESAGDSALWTWINFFFLEDLSAKDAGQSVGLFYFGGQFFIRFLQLLILPLIFTSLILAIAQIKDPARLKRISAKTLLWFGATSLWGGILAAVIGWSFCKWNLFSCTARTAAGAGEAASGNFFNLLLNIIPVNLVTAFSSNQAVLSIVLLALITALVIRKFPAECDIILQISRAVNRVVMEILNFLVEKIAPFALFMLLCRAIAVYGGGILVHALTYAIACTIILLCYLFLVYPFLIRLMTNTSAGTFLRTVWKVIVFAFSTSSSAATLPLNYKVTVEELHADPEIASFVLPLGMTINMDGTAIMQTFAALFIAGCGGYQLGLSAVITIIFLALFASIGTPAAPGAGAIVLFTVISGAGLTNESAMAAYAIILAINRPIEMLVTSLNCVGDSATAVIVSESERKADRTSCNG